MAGRTVSLPALATAPTTTETVASSPPGRGAATCLGHTVAAGTCLGRYTVIEHLGSGGMGEVYAAHDPELDRAVALKVLRPELAGRSPEARARFQREAQALARLHHPNVVAIHDVGVVDDRVFVAMELVDGVTLAAWLAERRRGWREAVDVFVQAGRGLAAAHAAGLVHRDFKPSNVMIGDRVCVVDFGLARPAPAAHTDDDHGGEAIAIAIAILDSTITDTGEALGTPAYMAPEHRAGAPASPRSDQYAFGVALHEALFGARPGAAVHRGRGVPSAVRAVVARALNPDPELRYPAMADLLADLERDPARARRRGLIAAGGIVALAGAIAVGRGADRAAPCSDAEARLAGVWDAARAAALGDAFAASGRPYAGAVWRQVRGQLDGYAGAWIEMHGEACRATRIEGRQSEHLLDLRMACLERRRSLLGALTGVWSRGVDGAALDAAGDAAAGLAPIAECGDAGALTDPAPLPHDPAHRVRIAIARVRLDDVRALTLAGHLPDARAAAASVRAEADAIGWPQLRAEAAFAEAVALTALGDPAAEPRFLDAARFAGQTHDDRLHADALVELVDHLAREQQTAGRALLAADIAAAAVLRAGDDDRRRIRLLHHRGDALVTAGNYAQARTALTTARELATARLGPRDGETLAVLGRLGSLAQLQGDRDAARALGEDNLAATSALLGPGHPRVAAILNALGNAAHDRGDFAAAVGYYRRALAILEITAGPEAAATAMALNNLGAIEIQRDELAAAEPLLDRALAIRERLLGPTHAHVAMTLGNLSLVRRKQGRFVEALALLERSRQIKLAIYGPMHASMAYTLEGIGGVEHQLGHAAAAIEAYRQALDVRRHALGAQHPMTAHSVGQLGEALARAGRCREARAVLAEVDEARLDQIARQDAAGILASLAHCDVADHRFARAVARIEPALARMQDPGFAVDRGEIRWLLSRALRGLGRRGDAIAAARLAEADLAVEPDGAASLSAVRAWIATQR